MPFLFKKKNTSEPVTQAIATQNGGQASIPTIDFGFSRFGQGQTTLSSTLPLQPAPLPLEHTSVENYSPPATSDYLSGSVPQHPFEQAYVPLPDVEMEEIVTHPPEYGYAKAHNQIESSGWNAVDWMSTPHEAPLEESDLNPLAMEDSLPYSGFEGGFNDPLPLTGSASAIFDPDDSSALKKDDFSAPFHQQVSSDWGSALTSFEPSSQSSPLSENASYGLDPFRAEIQSPEINSLEAIYAASPWAAGVEKSEATQASALSIENVESSDFIPFDELTLLEEESGFSVPGTWDSIPEPAPAAYPMPLELETSLTRDFTAEALFQDDAEPIVDITAPLKNPADPLRTGFTPILEKEEDFWSHTAPGFDDEDLQSFGEELSPAPSAPLPNTPGSPEYAGAMQDKVGLDYYPTESVNEPPASEKLVDLNEEVNPPENLEFSTPHQQADPSPTPFENLNHSRGEMAGAGSILAGSAYATDLFSDNTTHPEKTDEPFKTPHTLQETEPVIEVQPTIPLATGLEALCDPGQLSIQDIVVLSPQRVLFLGQLSDGNSALFGLGGDRLIALHRFDHNVIGEDSSNPLVFNHSLEGAANGKEMYLIQINRWKAVLSANDQGFALHTVLSL